MEQNCSESTIQYKLAYSQLPQNYDKAIEPFFFVFYDFLNTQNPDLVASLNLKNAYEVLEKLSNEQLFAVCYAKLALENEYPDYFKEYTYYNDHNYQDTLFANSIQKYSLKHLVESRSSDLQEKNTSIYGFSEFWIRLKDELVKRGIIVGPFEGIYAIGSVKNIEEIYRTKVGNFPNPFSSDFIIYKINLSIDESLTNNLFSPKEIFINYVVPDRHLPISKTHVIAVGDTILAHLSPNLLISNQSSCRDYFTTYATVGRLAPILLVENDSITMNPPTPYTGMPKDFLKENTYHNDGSWQYYFFLNDTKISLAQLRTRMNTYLQQIKH